MIPYMIAGLVIQVFGTLYPAYSSYKTVRTKNVKGYVQWMKYWIVFAFLRCAEPFCDFIFSSWVPFYYESKILMVAWLLCPATRGYNYLYRAFVHPTLMDNEEYIDDVLKNIKERVRQMILQIGKRGSTVMIQAMLKGLLSRSSFGSCFSRPAIFADRIFSSYDEIDERAILYHHPNALIRTLFLAENRRNSDPNSVRDFNELSRCVQLRRNTGLTNFESARFLDNGRRTSAGRELGDEERRSPGEKIFFSLQTLEEFDERNQHLPSLVNRRLALLARKLSLEGFSDDHIRTVVQTLISDLDTSLLSPSETEIPSKNDESGKPLIEEQTSEPENQIQIEVSQHNEVLENEGIDKLREDFETSVAISDLKQSRAGRYRKLRAPSPPDSKKVDCQELSH